MSTSISGIPQGAAARQAQASAAQAEQAAQAAQDAGLAASRAAQAAAEAAGGPRPGVSINREAGGQRVITVPNRNGGMDRIVFDEDGMTINGQPVLDGNTTFAPDFKDAMPTGVVDIVQALVAMVVLTVVGLPLARAFARRLDRRGAAAHIPPEVMSRLANIENAVETVAVEVERISEGQRFTAKLLSDRANERANDPLHVR